MAHSALPPQHSRRRLEIVGGVLLLIVAVVASVITIIALRHPNGHDAPKANGSVVNTVTPSPSKTTAVSTPVPSTPAQTTPAQTTPAKASTTPTAVSGRLPLVVLNNTSTNGLAATAAARFRAAGWTVTDISSFDGDIVSTAAYFDPDVAGAEAAANALQGQFPAIHRVRAKFDGLPAGPVVVVVTSDYS
jgi:hypothetical protein